MRRAVNLWSANEFWPGADFYGQPDLEDWVRDLRQEAGYSFQRTLERLAYNAAANGEHELALLRARRALQLDPLNDELNANIFNWLVNSGQRSKAVEHCQALCALYKRDGTPLPDHLARPGRQTARVMATQTGSAPMDPWPRSLVNAGPFINRPEAMHSLKQAFSRGGQVLLEGEAGVGKTRLMAETFRGVAPAPRLILASCRDENHTLPYQAMIRTIRHQILQAEWQALERVWVAQLTRLMPELATLRPDVEPAPQLAENKSTLLEAIYQLMLVVARPGKLLFILDDAQWHDPVSLNALRLRVPARIFYAAWAAGGGLPAGRRNAGIAAVYRRGNLGAALPTHPVGTFLSRRSGAVNPKDVRANPFERCDQPVDARNRRQPALFTGKPVFATQPGSAGY